MSNALPRFIIGPYGSARKYRAAHRKRLKRIKVALDEARLGCAYTPAYRHLQIIQRELNLAIEACRPTKWRASSAGGDRAEKV